MLSTDVMKQIKQSNVSKDAEKTKLRIKEAFAAAPKDIRAAIVEQTTQHRNTIYRAINTGNASGRIVLAFAEALDISPYWFTGAIDEKAPCTDADIENFLVETGNKKKTGGKKKSVKKSAKKPAKKAAKTAKVAKTASKTPVAEKKAVESTRAKAKASDAMPSPITAEAHPTVFRVAINESEQMRVMVDKLDLASATQLLEALYIRAKAGGNAEQLCEIVKYCLLA